MSVYSEFRLVSLALRLLPFSALFWVLAQLPVMGQITPDNTLGSENSIVSPNQSIQDLPADLIKGGAVRGSNLFHSFLEFNVNNNQRVYFANPTGIETILSRVTGTDVSDILGTLGVNGGADLFFLNPNGIIFGPNARLDIAGSFHASTATGWIFSDGSKFSAVDPAAPPLLTVNIAPGLQFGTTSGVIQQRGQLFAGQDLQLSADALDLQGQMGAGRDLRLDAQGNVVIRDTLLNPAILAAGQDLVVQGNNLVDIFALNHPQSGIFAGGNLTLRSANPVSGDAHFWSGGNFSIEQLNDNLGNLVSLNDPIIFTGNDVSLASYTGASLHILAGGSVFILGDIFITQPDTTNALKEDVTLSDGRTVVSIDGSARSTVDIRAGIDWAKRGGDPGDQVFPADLTNQVFLGDLDPTTQSADILLGNIYTNAVGGTGGQVFLTNQYFPNPLPTVFGGIVVGNITPGDLYGGGQVLIDARSDVLLNGTVNLSSFDLSSFDPVNYPQNSYLGNGGDFVLLAQHDVQLSSGSQLLSDGLLGGSIRFDIGGTFLADNAVIRNDTYTSTVGLQSGDLNITANQIQALNGSSFSTNTFGKGNAGAIDITATGDIALKGLFTGIASGVFPGAEGFSGGITLTASNLSLSDGAVITASTQGKGYAGDITINTHSLSGRGLFAIGSGAFSDGNAGNVIINADGSIYLDGEGLSGLTIFGSGIASATIGKGNGANINITADSLIMRNGVQLQSSTAGTGNAGNITLHILGHSLNLELGSVIEAQSLSSQGNGGNVTINAPNADILIDGTISTDDFGLTSFSKISTGTNINSYGKGGDVIINSKLLSLANGAQINTSTYGQGNAGAIDITATGAISLTRSVIGSTVESGAEGSSGGITIDTGNLTLTDGAVINASTQGKGNAGAVNITATNSVSLTGESSQGNVSNIQSEVKPGAEGSSGGIILTAGSLSLRNGAGLGASAFGKGNAGAIVINTTDFLAQGESSRGLISQVTSGVAANTAVGNAGGITLTASGNVSLLDGAFLDASTFGKGNAGAIVINTTDFLAHGESSQGGISGVGSLVQGNAVGNAGGITLTASGKVSLLDGAVISASTFGKGNAGAVNITATNSVSLAGESSKGYVSNIRSEVFSGAEGTSGGITLTTDSLSLSNGTVITASTYGKGNAGAVNITATNSVSLTGESSKGNLSNIQSGVVQGAEGTSGGIALTAGSLSLSNGAGITASTYGKGNAGAVNITATNSVSLTGESSQGNVSNIQSEVKLGAEGSSGGIILTAGSLSLRNGAGLGASTFGKGNAGAIVINTTDFLAQGESSRGLISQVTSGVAANTAVGNAGGISLTASDKVSLLDGAFLDASTSGKGNAGAIVINTTDFLAQGESSGGNRSNVSSQVTETAVGNSGEIILTASGKVSLLDGAFLDASTFGQGNAGAIVINTTDFLAQDESSSGNISYVGSGVLPGAEGNSGGISLTASGNVSLLDGAFLDASTFGQGNAGAIVINTTDFLAQGESSGGNRSNVSSQVALETAVGNSGGISLTASSLSLRDGAAISASTSGKGNAGAVTLHVADSVSLAGEDSQGYGSNIQSGIFSGAEGSSGGITLTAGSLSLKDGTGIFASTQGKGNAGVVDITATDSVTLQGQTKAGKGSQILSQVEEGATGNANEIFLTAPQITLLDGAVIAADTAGTGNARSIIINASDSITLGSQTRLSVETSSSGTPGDIEVTTPSLSIGEDAQLSATVKATSTNTEGGGNITLNISDLDMAGRLGIFAETNSTASAGSLKIQPYSTDPTLGIQFRDNGFISASTTAQGNGGSISLTAPETIDVRGQGSIAVTTSGSGAAGNIEFTAPQINLSDGVTVTGSTTGTGIGGTITVDAADQVSLVNARLETSTEGSGNAGNIDLKIGRSLLISGTNAGVFVTTQTGATGNGGTINLQHLEGITNALTLNLSQGAALSANTAGQANAGSIRLHDIDTLTLDVGQISTEITPTGAATQPSDIEIEAKTLTLENGSEITADNHGTGNAGNIDLAKVETLTIAGGSSISSVTSGQGNSGKIDLTGTQTITGTDGTISTAVLAGGQGQGGSITIATATLDLTGTNITSSTAGKGDTGTIAITARQGVTLDQNSEISTAVKSGATGNAQQIDIFTPQLSLNQSQITASTSGTGNAGRINLTGIDGVSTQQIELNNNSSITTAVNTEATGNAGQITLSAQTLSLDNGSTITARTAGFREPGLNNAGQIDITTVTTTLQNGSTIQTNTAGSGTAGNINLIAAEGLFLSDPNSGIFSSTEEGSTGNAGNITIDPSIVDIRDGAGIAVNSKGSGIGGNITLFAGDLNLTNNAFISALTRSSSGGNIDLLINNNLILQNNSFISTEAGTAQSGGNGGNITLSSFFTIGRNNSNIIANAFEGNGGNININTNGLFGFTVKNVDNPFIDRRNNITASSQLGSSGVTSINNAVDPAQGLSVLPVNLVNPGSLIDRHCDLARTPNASRFVILGKGGLPATARDLLSFAPLWTDLDLSTPVRLDSSLPASPPTLAPLIPSADKLRSSLNPGEPLQISRAIGLTQFLFNRCSN